MSQLSRAKLNIGTEVNNKDKNIGRIQNGDKNATSVIEFMFKMESKKFVFDPQLDIRRL